MSEATLVAIIVSMPPTVAAIAAWRQATKAHKQVTPSNGTPTAEIVEEIQKDVRGLKDDMQYHVTVQHGRGPTEDG